MRFLIKYTLQRLSETFCYSYYIYWKSSYSLFDFELAPFSIGIALRPSSWDIKTGKNLIKTNPNKPIYQKCTHDFNPHGDIKVQIRESVRDSVQRHLQIIYVVHAYLSIVSIPYVTFSKPIAAYYSYLPYNHPFGRLRQRSLVTQ